MPFLKMPSNDVKPWGTHWSIIAFRLILATLFYNLFEAGVALWFGFHASSIALVGFGFDSVIETAAATVVLWRFHLENTEVESSKIEHSEKQVYRFVGATFFLLALYVLIDSLSTLFNGSAPEKSLIGIILAALSLFIMPVLAFFKLKAADQVGSRALRAEAKETLACSYLSFTLLLGLGLHSLFGFWWADPAAALLMVPWLIREGFEGFEE